MKADKAKEYGMIDEILARRLNKIIVILKNCYRGSYIY